MITPREEEITPFSTQTVSYPSELRTDRSQRSKRTSKMSSTSTTGGGDIGEENTRNHVNETKTIKEKLAST